MPLEVVDSPLERGLCERQHPTKKSGQPAGLDSSAREPGAYVDEPGAQGCDGVHEERLEGDLGRA